MCDWQIHWWLWITKNYRNSWISIATNVAILLCLYIDLFVKSVDMRVLFKIMLFFCTCLFLFIPGNISTYYRFEIYTFWILNHVEFWYLASRPLHILLQSHLEKQFTKMFLRPPNSLKQGMKSKVARRQR